MNTDYSVVKLLESRYFVLLTCIPNNYLVKIIQAKPRHRRYAIAKLRSKFSKTQI